MRKILALTLLFIAGCTECKQGSCATGKQPICKTCIATKAEEIKDKP